MRWLGAALAVWMLACGTIIASVDAGPDATAPFTEAAIRAATTAYMTKFCPAMQKCDPAVFNQVHGTAETCIGSDRPLADLTDDWFGFGSSATPESIQACADALDLSACDAFVGFVFEGVIPEACNAMSVGTLSVGSSCRNNNQCSTGRCSGPRGSVNGCGVCIPRLPVGASCKFQYGCVAGAICWGPPNDQRCTAFRNLGEACDSTNLCHLDLRCVDHTCQRWDPTAICTPIGAADGSPSCAPIPQFYRCNSASARCQAPIIAQVGASCGPPANSGGNALCAHGSFCSIEPGVGDGGQTHTCVAQLDDGDSCNANGVAFFFDAPCKHGTCYRDTCRRNGAAECSAPPVPP